MKRKLVSVIEAFNLKVVLRCELLFPFRKIKWSAREIENWSLLIENVNRVFLQVLYLRH